MKGLKGIEFILPIAACIAGIGFILTMPSTPPIKKPAAAEQGIWVSKLECGQCVTKTTNFEDWLTRNSDKTLISVTWVYQGTPQCAAPCFYIVYLPAPGSMELVAEKQ